MPDSSPDVSPNAPALDGMPDDPKLLWNKIKADAEALLNKAPVLRRIIPIAPNASAKVVSPPAGDDQVTCNGLTVREIAKLAAHAYKPEGSGPWAGNWHAGAVPDGWTILHATPFAQSGYASAEYVDTKGNYVCAFRGTDEKIDWAANIEQGANLFTMQYDLANQLAHELAWKFQNRNLYVDDQYTHARSLTFTGHSLGGGLAGSAWTLTGYPTVTFNAAGVSLMTRFDDNFLSQAGETQTLDKPDGPCTNYHVNGEILSTMQYYLSLKTGWQKLNELLHVGLAAPAAGHHIMLQRPDRTKVFAPFAPPDLSLDVLYRVELHLMISVIPALDLPSYPEGENAPDDTSPS